MSHYSHSNTASFCEKSLPMPPLDGKVALIRPGITFGNCFHDFDRPLPSCPNLKMARKDSIWEKNNKVVHIFGFKLETSNDVIHIDNAFLNLTFSAPNVLQLPTDSKVKMILRVYELMNKIYFYIFYKFDINYFLI